MTPIAASFATRRSVAAAEIVELIRQPEVWAGLCQLARVLQPVGTVTRCDSEIGQGLLTLTPGDSCRGQIQDNAPEEIHILSIQVSSLPEDLRDALSITRDEHAAWLTAAAERGRSLLVLKTDDSVDFYTTNQDRFVALRPVIESLAARVKNLPGLGKARTVERRGTDAARQLMVHAAKQTGSTTTHPGSSIHGAAALSAASTALGPTLGSLFRAAANVGRRVRQETALNSHIDPALEEMEAFAAERIVEEELATWQAQEAEIQRATSEIPRVEAPRHATFDRPEPISEVKLRVGTTIRPRISYLLEPKSVSS